MVDHRDYDLAAGRAQQEAQRGQHTAQRQTEPARLKHYHQDLIDAALTILASHDHCDAEGIDSYDGINHERDIAMLREALDG